MAEGILAQLKVLIGADIAKLKSGLDEAQVKSAQSSRKIQRDFHQLGSAFSRLLPLSQTGRQVSVAIDAIAASAAEANRSLSTMGSTFGLIGGIGMASVGALAGITLKLFDGLEETAHAAAGVGMGVAQYAELTQALKVFDINQEQANQALAYFEKILSGLVRSKAGAKAIQELGLNMEQLRKMNPHDALLAVADAFSKLQDGTMKAGIAAALFENTYGIKLVPFLNQGGSAIERLESRFKGLGDATQANAEAAENLTAAWEGFKSGLESAALDVSDVIGIPVMLEAIAHPLATLEVIILGFGDTATGVFADVAAGIGHLVKEIDVGLSSLHLPQIPTSGLNEATQFLRNLSTSFGLEGGKIAEGIVSSGQHGPGNGAIKPSSGNGYGNQPNHAAAYLKQLHEQLADFGKGEVARGLEHLKDLGATQAQLSQGRGLLDAIQALKDEKGFSEGLGRAQKSMTTMLGKLKTDTGNVSGLAGAFENLTNKIREAGAAALGIKNNPGQALRKQWLAGLGTGPIGGSVPGFTPSGFGKMRFDMEKLSAASKELGKNMSQSFTRMIEYGQGFQQMLANLVREFEAFLIKTMLFKELGSSLSGQGGFLGVVGNFFSGMALPGRASGGPVTAGSLYMVGEQGPELFAPSMSGSIIPHGAMGGGRGGNTYVDIDARGADAGVEHRIRRAMVAAQKQAVGQSLVASYEYRARGGKM